MHCERAIALRQITLGDTKDLAPVLTGHVPDAAATSWTRSVVEDPFGWEHMHG